MINKLKHENEEQLQSFFPKHRTHQLGCHFIIGETSSYDGMNRKGIPRSRFIEKNCN